MLKACWKCKNKFDTQIVDESVTVGLCQRCYDKFDDAGTAVEPAQAFAAQAAPTEVVGIDPAMGPSATNATVMGPSPMTGSNDGSVVLMVVEVTTNLEAVSEEIEYTRKKIMDALRIPEEYRGSPNGPPPEFGSDLSKLLPEPNMETLKAELARAIDEVRTNFAKDYDIEELKDQLRRHSIKALSQNAPPNVTLGMVEKLVDEVIEEVFRGVESSGPKMLAQANR